MSSSEVTTPSAGPVAEFMAENGADFLDRMNGDFADALLLVGRALSPHPAATAVELTGVDAGGVDAIASDDAGAHRVRIEFDDPVVLAEDLTTALLGLVTKAREVSGEDGSTSADREAAALSVIRTFLTEVVAVEDVHPHLRKVTFGGGDLRTFDPIGPDTFLYLLLPPPGRTELSIDQSFTWEAYGRMADEDKPVGAYYTLRRWRPELAEMDVLMVLHEDDHDGDHAGGHASRWAARAQVGDRVALWGPRTAYDPPAGTEHLLLVADETGLPAVAVMLEQLPAGCTAHVVAEVADATEHQELPDRPGTSVTWLHRDGAAPGTTSLQVDAVAALAPFDRPTYVWGGGESRSMTAVRRHVRDVRGLDRASVSLVAYWRHRATSDADAADD